MTLHKNIWKKISYTLITVSIPIFIAACFGMPYKPPTLGYWNIKTIDKNNTPIYGLHVSILHYSGTSSLPDTMEHGFTDVLGVYWSSQQNTLGSNMNNIKALIQDTDGGYNGGYFTDTLFVWDGSEKDTVIMRNFP